MEFHNFPRSTTSILIIYSSDIVVVTLFTNVTYPSYCLWNYKRYVNFVNNVITTLSDEEMTKIKLVDLDKFCNFYVHDFFIWNQLVFQNNVWPSLCVLLDIVPLLSLFFFYFLGYRCCFGKFWLFLFIFLIFFLHLGAQKK